MLSVPHVSRKGMDSMGRRGLIGITFALLLSLTIGPQTTRAAGAITPTEVYCSKLVITGTTDQTSVKTIVRDADTGETIATSLTPAAGGVFYDVLYFNAPLTSYANLTISAIDRDASGTDVSELGSLDIWVDCKGTPATPPW